MCVLALASASYGEVIGDFGNGTDGLDGWVTMPGEAGPDLAPTTASVSTIGATLGSTSLKLVSSFPSGYGWYEGKIDKVLTAGQAASVADGTYNKFKLDVARFSDDWSAGAWGWWTPENQLFFSLSASAWNDLGVQKFVGGGREILGANWYPSMLATYRAPENRLPWRDGVQYADPDGTMATSCRSGYSAAARSSGDTNAASSGIGASVA